MKKINLVFVICFCWLFMTHFIQATEGEFSQKITQIDKQIPALMQTWQVPGLAVAIVKDGKVFTKGYGHLHNGQDHAANADTLFAIGSITKSFTASALAMLVDSKQIDFDDLVHVTMPATSFNSDFLNDNVSIRDLLSHRTGLEKADLLWYESGLDRSQLIERIPFLKTHSPFRSTFQYNNLMYLVAGQIIPQVTGISWDDFIERQIVKPLNMVRTSTSSAQVQKMENVAFPHMNIDGEIRSIRRENNDNVGPEGSIYSSANDMAQWVKMLLAQGTFEDKPLISKSSLNCLWTPHITIAKNSMYGLAYPLSKTISYGLGWFLWDYYGHCCMQHAGKVDGMAAQLVVVPDSDLGIVILTNIDNPGFPVILSYIIMDSLLNVQAMDWNAFAAQSLKQRSDYMTAIEQKLQAERKVGTTPSLALEKYAGTYTNDLYGDLDISVKNGKLFIDLLAFHGEIDHWQNDTFRWDMSRAIPTEPAKPFVVFNVQQGVVSGLTIKSEAIDAMFTRPLAN